MNTGYKPVNNDLASFKIATFSYVLTKPGYTQFTLTSGFSDVISPNTVNILVYHFLKRDFIITKNETFTS
jgi:hypothetical protein